MCSTVIFIVPPAAFGQHQPIRSCEGRAPKVYLSEGKLQRPLPSAVSSPQGEPFQR